MSPVNDQTCGWLKNFNQRTNIQILKDNHECDFIIIGAGFTGLSAARKLAHIYTDKKIVIVAILPSKGAWSAELGNPSLIDGFITPIELNIKLHKSSKGTIPRIL